MAQELTILLIEMNLLSTPSCGIEHTDTTTATTINVRARHDIIKNKLQMVPVASYSIIFIFPPYHLSLPHAGVF